MIEGYEVPVHRSLSDVILLGGVPRTPAILLWTTATALGFGMQLLQHPLPLLQQLKL